MKKIIALFSKLIEGLQFKVRDFWKRDAERAEDFEWRKFKTIEIPPVHRIWKLIKWTAIITLVLWYVFTPISPLGYFGREDIKEGDAKFWSSYHEIYVSTYLGYHTDGEYCFASVKIPEGWSQNEDFELMMTQKQKETLKPGDRVSFSKKIMGSNHVYFLLSEQEVEKLVAKGLPVIDFTKD